MTTLERYFDAITCRDACEAGRIVLCGKPLKPFSLFHSLALEVLDSPLWTADREATAADYLIAAEVCSQSRVAPAPPPLPGKLVNLNREQKAWGQYMALCVLTRPLLWLAETGDDGASPAKVPWQEYIITWILRHTNGYTRDWLWTAPLSEVHWIFESLGEHVTGRCRVLTDEDAEFQRRESTPKAERARARREKIAARIFAAGFDPKTRLSLLKALDAGKLRPEDLKRALAAKRRRKGRV